MLPPSKGQTPLYTSMFVLGPSFSHMQKKVSGFHGLTSYDSVTFSFFLFFFRGGEDGLSLSVKAIPRMF